MPELICAASDPRWLDERRKGITATDITAIMGLSPYESEYSLYWKKLGHIPDVREDSDRLRLGRDLEPYVLARWREATGSIQTGKPHGGLYRHSERIWQMATLDARKVHNEPVELKTWADADKSSWADAPPPQVRAQVLWQMDTLDVAVGHVGVLLLPSGEFRSYVIEHGGGTYDAAIGTHGNFDELQSCEVCRDIDLMRAAGEEFMARLRLELPPPSPDASSATLAALKARFADPAKTKEAEVSAMIWSDYKIACEDIAYAEETKRRCEAEIQEQIGEAGIITVNGIKVATRQRYPVKAHMRKASTVDRIVRSKNGDGDE